MSHFAVMVIGGNVTQQLAPYHEFECTSTVDEYVQSISTLEEMREAYEKQTRSMLRGPQGELASPYDERFYRDPTEDEANKISAAGHRSSGICYTAKDWEDGKGYRPKVQYIPDGWEQTEVLVKEMESLLEYIIDEYSEDFPILKVGDEPDLHDEKQKWGWVRVNEDGEVIECIKRTNPNAKWDWWCIGGRWANSLKLKEPKQRWTLRVTRDNTQPPGSQVALSPIPLHLDGDMYVNQAVKGDLDFDGMRDEAGVEAAAEYDKIVDGKVTAGLTADDFWDSWHDVRSRHTNIDEARAEYWAQPALKAIEKLSSPFSDIDRFLVPREQYIQQARDAALVYYAVVKDGQWFAKGEMGWFGMSDDSMTQAEWNQKVNELLDELPDDALITIVDCHI